MIGVLATPAMAILSVLYAAAGGLAPVPVHADRARPPRAAWVPEVPTSLVDALSVATNDANTCRRTSIERWPHEAEECRYGAAGRTWTLTTATPPPERVARWIVDASSFLPAVAHLRERDHAAWEDALVVMARFTIAQSGRVFPLDGVVWEDFEGPTGYVFHDGVTFGTFGGPLATCRACACRIDSLTRPVWCSYAADVRGGTSRSECLATLGGDTGWDDAWADTCLRIHDEAWSRDANEGFRAIAYFVDEHQIAPAFPDPDAAEPAAVVSELARAYAHPAALTRRPEPPGAGAP